MFQVLLSIGLAGAMLLGTAAASFATQDELPADDQGVTAEINSEFNLGDLTAPVFTDGFADLSALIEMGTPLQNAHLDDDGHITQLTTAGLAYWLPDENQPSFTDGWDRWALTDQGLATWKGDSLTAVFPVPMAVVTLYDSPRSYLYAVAPASVVRRLDCIVSHESNWNPNAVNRSSGASGLFQFLASTWRITPPGRAGYSVFEPYRNIDGGIWLYLNVGASQWEVVLKGYC